MLESFQWKTLTHAIMENRPYNKYENLIAKHAL